jgi:hypothetical protein
VLPPDGIWCIINSGKFYYFLLKGHNYVKHSS